jgi:predicted acylesterase/phospholipase RssA
MGILKRAEPRGAGVGLVLGAGGIRGCAHAGAIAVLQESHVPIDLVVGASVGAIFGLGLAAGVPAERIARVARDATPLDMFRFYAGRLRTDRKNPVARLLHEAGDGRRFEDLEIPFAVLGTDMQTGKPHVINQGSVLPAVQASIALPFVARPVAIDGNFYLDGGLRESAPVGVARRLGAERVIAICLGYDYPAPAFLRRRPWTRELLERAGRQRRAIHGRFHDQIRFGCRLYASAYDPAISAHEADVAIWPEFDGLSPNSMFGARFCYDQGEAATRQALPRIAALLADTARSA